MSARGLCGTCGRSRFLAGGVLPEHDNLGGPRCDGTGRLPMAPSPAEVTFAEGLAEAGTVLAALPAAGLVLAGGVS